MSRITKTGRFIYAGPYRTREKADDVLEDMYASGDARPGEGIKVEPVPGLDGRTRYAITLPTG
jgi:hypothetical protein